MSVPDPFEQAPGVSEFRRDVLEGLRAGQKTLPCKYFYDETGSRLFDAITELEEYYPTRTEVGILSENLEDIAAHLGPQCLVVEFGAGSGLKTEQLLGALEEPAGYVPIDISGDHLLESVARLRDVLPDVEVLPVVADYTESVELPAPRRPVARRVFFFPGSTIGNFEREEADAFLRRIARLVRPGGGLLIGMDRRKDRRTLERAYDDAKGVTAAFNRNLLVRANRELGADFRPERFRHRAVWNEAAGRVEMHLESKADQIVRIGEESFRFREGETIWTESSHKYAPGEFREMAATAGFRLQREWSDADERFSVQYHVAVGDGDGATR